MTRRCDVQLHESDLPQSSSLFVVIIRTPHLGTEVELRTLCQRLFQVDIESEYKTTLLQSTHLHRYMRIDASMHYNHNK
jgi:hypothetical protein